jgi:hypothetical protein
MLIVRIVDTVFKAFQACAGSQGTCNKSVESF